jgi:hypothetical protein
MIPQNASISITHWQKVFTEVAWFIIATTPFIFIDLLTVKTSKVLLDCLDRLEKLGHIT